jgi:thioredoxin reductase (NADPH)
MMNEILDILIIGGGPIGMACGIEAKNAGLEYLIMEKGSLVNSLYHYPLNMTFFSTSERLEIGGVPFVSISSKPTRSEALEYYRRVATTYQLKVHLFEKVISAYKQDNVFTVHTSKAAYYAKNIVLATGFYDIPNLMDIPGEELPKVTHYYHDPHFYAFQNIVVVGANNSSVDVALETYRKGAHVTMVVRQGEIGRRVKYWVKPDIENRIKEGSIKAWFHSELKAIRELEVDIQTPDGMITIPNDFVLAMTGYMPNFEMLKKLDIDLSNDGKCTPSYHPETMETNVEGIYLAGVVCGGMDTHSWFIENSREHAPKIVKAIQAKQNDLMLKQPFGFGQ